MELLDAQYVPNVSGLIPESRPHHEMDDFALGPRIDVVSSFFTSILDSNVASNDVYPAFTSCIR